MLQLNEDDAGNYSDDANADDKFEQPAAEVSASPVKSKKKRKKKAKDKSSNDTKSAVLYYLSQRVMFLKFALSYTLCSLTGNYTTGKARPRAHETSP